MKSIRLILITFLLNRCIAFAAEDYDTNSRLLDNLDITTAPLYEDLDANAPPPPLPSAPPQELTTDDDDIHYFQPTQDSPDNLAIQDEETNVEDVEDEEDELDEDVESYDNSGEDPFSNDGLFRILHYQADDNEEGDDLGEEEESFNDDEEEEEENDDNDDSYDSIIPEFRNKETVDFEHLYPDLPESEGHPTADTEVYDSNDHVSNPLPPSQESVHSSHVQPEVPRPRQNTHTDHHYNTTTSTTATKSITHSYWQLWLIGALFLVYRVSRRKMWHRLSKDDEVLPLHSKDLLLAAAGRDHPHHRIMKKHSLRKPSSHARQMSLGHSGRELRPVWENWKEEEEAERQDKNNNSQW
ncbi:hypothetical protein EC973_009086 [Apophysomyces ossiformis]|uniref:Uncharacterized protein n=1 Tax=Apophysomyces ossiformis TaxID=679940 RepID=A0A8H7BW16_9FUNG|nr:hypothetical protein EC973_009086 [Apophysomyces ossiformis]